MREQGLLNSIADKLDHVYIACGKTDLRRGIDGLVAIIQTEFKLDPFSKSLFLFCGTRSDRIKGIVYDGDGFLLLYKRIEKGRFRWPRNPQEARELTHQQFRWLTEGLKVDQPHALKSSDPMDYC